MLPTVEVTRQITASQHTLGRVRRALLDDPNRSDLYRTVRDQVDVLTCLLDESETKVHFKIKSLIYEFEAVAKRTIS